MCDTAVRRVGVRYGWIEKIVIGGVVLLLLWTYFQCVPKNWNFDVDLPDTDDERNPTITVSPGVLSISPEILGDDSAIQVTSHSSVPVDIAVTAEDGQNFFYYAGLVPGGAFSFAYDEGPCQITASAS
jgi:hypothetical protein